jgi:ATP phosphoribosyltransferase regulatory subunit
LPSLNGDRDALVEGVARLARTPAAAPARRLLALFDAAVARGFAEHLTADLGEVRGFAYYTGTVLHAYAAGTGDAIVSGGRYDELLGRFGWDLPAAGFAIDLDRVAEALLAAGVTGRTSARALVIGPADDRRLADLRARGVAAVSQREGAGALAWARAWGFTHVLDSSGWVDAATGTSIASPLDAEERGQK